MRRVLGNGSRVKARESKGMSEARQVLPLSATMRRMAQSVLHDRVVIKQSYRHDPSLRGTAKRPLNDEQVKLIRKLYGPITLEQLAILVGLSAASVKNIITGQSYSKVL